MTKLEDLVEAFKREVAVPGAFATDFPSTSDDDLTEALKDAYGMARLDGFFGMTQLENGVVTPELSVAGASLIVLYAGLRMTRQQLRVLKTTARYKAGPTEYETQQSAAAITEDLRQLERRRKELVDQATRAGRNRGSTFVIDAYAARGSGWHFYGGFLPHEYGSFGSNGLY
jgi:hypothetical protein